MPTINKTTKGKYNAKRERNDLDRKKRQKIYQNPLWKRLRDAHLREHPLCEISLLEGRTVLAEDVHHWRSFTEGRTEMEMKTLAFDPNNLVALSKLAHWEIHHGIYKGCKSLDEVKQRIDAGK
ncbi:MAG: hypothetical protein HDS66_00030 [Bacteroidales bacterium]|nr:hypothetical protein [Bacteroidales bacterium]